ncbi:MAG: sigma-70 family RNA polymerase sigma factor [Brumimicrobium sp.]
MILKLLRKYTQYSDEQLVEKYQADYDVYYAALLFERYNEMTVSLALNYLKNETDAEDATMECFEIMVNDLKGTKVENFGGWYYSVVRNYLLKVKRHREKHYSVDLVEGYHDKADDDIQFENLFNDEKLNAEELINEVLKGLKPMQVKCIKMFYLEGKSYKAIVEALNISEKDVKSHVQNGKRKMKIILENKNVKSIDEIS